MKIKFSDINDVLLSGVEIQFEWNKNKKKFITDNDGCIEFTEASQGEKITCFVSSKDKQKFIFDPELDVSVIFKPLLADMIFLIVNKDGRPVPGVNIFFEISGEKSEKTSDFSGQIILNDVPLNTEVRAYQLDDGEKRNISNHKFSGKKSVHKISVEILKETKNMRIKLVDKSGQIIRDGQIKVRVDNKEFDGVTGQDGCILIENLDFEAIIECKQVLGNKQFPWHKFKYEEGIDEYILHGEKSAIYTGYSSKIESQVRMKFRLVTTKGIPIPNAVIKIEYGENVRHKYSNQSGETIIDDVLIGDKVKVFVDIRGKSTQADFICQEDNELHEIIFKSVHIPLYFWLIPLFLIIVFIVYFASSNSTTEEKTQSSKSEQKKDSVVITKYSFFVKDSKTDKPISEASIKLVYSDTLVEKKTDQNGFVVFNAFAHHLPLKYELKMLGYIPFSEKFKLDSVFKVKLVFNDSMEIDPVIAACGTEFQSKGVKTTIRSFKMNLPKGRFNLWFNMFNFPTRLDVYKGSYKNMSPGNLIYSNQGFVKGIGNPVINLDSPDSIITVSMEGNAAKTGWVYKVYCARVPVKMNVAPVVQNPQ